MSLYKEIPLETAERLANEYNVNIVFVKDLFKLGVGITNLRTVLQVTHDLFPSIGVGKEDLDLTPHAEIIARVFVDGAMRSLETFEKILLEALDSNSVDSIQRIKISLQRYQKRQRR